MHQNSSIRSIHKRNSLIPLIHKCSADEIQFELIIELVEIVDEEVGY